MKVVRLEQGTPAWLAWRHEGIGGSDAPIVLGISPYCSAKRLWETKTGVRQPEDANWAMKRGTRNEPMVIEKYQEKTGNVVSPVCIEHDKVTWLRASLDGMDLMGNVIVEAKCLKKEFHYQALDGKCPEHVYPQIQHQLHVSGIDLCHYCSWSEHKDTALEDQLVILDVKRDEEFIEKLILKERKFWAMIETKRWIEEK